jgi:rRNA-processing protein FCF1
MIKVILDTNFLIYCAKHKLDYVEEIDELLSEGHEIVVPLQVVFELEKLRDDKLKKVSGADKQAAGLAMQIIEFNKIKKIDIPGSTVDNALIKLAGENKKNIVATLDRGMRIELPRVILINRFKKLMLAR